MSQEERTGKASPMDFTYNAREVFQETVRRQAFRERNEQTILHALTEELKPVFFCDFLKRYIYRKAEMKQPFGEIPVETYQQIIQAEFADRHVPAGFEGTSARLKSLSRNWLTQKTAGREVALLLGFGLGMPPEDVNGFLRKALQETGLNPTDPMEALCWYCYRNRLNYDQFDVLRSRYRSLAEGRAPAPDDGELTAAYRDRLSLVNTEEKLMRYLLLLPAIRRSQSLTARRHFDRLYAETRQTVARMTSGPESGKGRENARRGEKTPGREQPAAGKTETGRGENAAERITPAEVERVLYAAVPRTAQGNLASIRGSLLYGPFYGKRMTRQRITEILEGRTAVNRSDLTTLLFFLHAQNDEDAEPAARYEAFLDSADRVLTACGMEPMYVASQYECFLMMCMLTEDPFASFADVWELSYDQTGKTAEA